MSTGTLLILLALTARNSQWVSDTWIHTATLTEVARHPLHPLEPLTGENAPFAYYSPWAMLLGWLVHWTGFSPFVVLACAGLVSTALFAISLRRLTRALTRARWAPVLSLALVLLLWGTGTWFWSGFPALGTLSVGFVWPSVLATALWFELWRAALRLTQLSPLHRAAVFLLLPGLLFLIHPFTFLVATLAVGITLLGYLPRQWRSVLTVAAASAVSVVGAMAWPWFTLSALVGDQEQFDAIHHGLYRHPMLTTGWVLLALCLPALLWRLRNDNRDPLAWTALLSATVVLIGAVTQRWSLGRMGPGAAIPAQLALSLALARDWRTHQPSSAAGRWASRAYAAATVLALLIGANANAWALARAVPDPQLRARAERATDAVAPYPNLAWLDHRIPAGSTVLANYWTVQRELPTFGWHNIALPWPNPAVPDEAQRARDAATILDPATSTEARSALYSRYGARWIIWSPSSQGRQYPFPGARLVACGPYGMALLSLDAAAPPPLPCPG